MSCVHLPLAARRIYCVSANAYKSRGDNGWIPGTSRPAALKPRRPCEPAGPSPICCPHRRTTRINAVISDVVPPSTYCGASACLGLRAAAPARDLSRYVVKAAIIGRATLRSAVLHVILRQYWSRSGQRSCDYSMQGVFKRAGQSQQCNVISAQKIFLRRAAELALAEICWLKISASERFEPRKPLSLQMGRLMNRTGGSPYDGFQGGVHHARTSAHTYVPARTRRA
jgi:hypothetical protein